MAFNLPTPEGAHPVGLTNTGLLYRGATIPYHQILRFKANNDTELQIEFREGTTVKDEDDEDVETLVLDTEPECSHQFFNIQAMIETYLMQLGQAQMDPTGEKVAGIRYRKDGETEWSVEKHILFDLKKVRKGAAKAFAFGG